MVGCYVNTPIGFTKDPGLRRIPYLEPRGLQEVFDASVVRSCHGFLHKSRNYLTGKSRRDHFSIKLPTLTVFAVRFL